MTIIDLYRKMLIPHIATLLVPIYLLIFSTMVQATPSFTSSSSNCITFDSEERIITVACRTSNLTEINNQLKDPGVLHRDEVVDKGWILNAGIIVTQNATLYVNSSDSPWLKI